MWDDHDIFDGWGSYPQRQQECPVHQGIYAVARKHFQVFQLRSDGKSLEDSFLHPEKSTGQVPTFCSLHHIGTTGLLVLDLRSERTETQVMHPDTWQLVYDAVDKLAAQHPECRHLMIVSSIPVVYPDFNFIDDPILRIAGHEDLKDFICFF